ncbi:MAG: aminopeptidase N, partial [Cardiobacteriaceae bacterium]|nr:aminopeptidase N [Cardiobacteriaceae bacterium]
QSLIDAIQWDEKRFNLSYDLKLFNIVAISDFNMGAMENKSLNIFNTKFVLADIESATDEDFHGIRAVIGHEYFHNWTGNRITCRDWFQLSLKEGLTVFRDQEFSSDMGERSLERIGDVIRLRSMQFPEDAGPMSHPVQPQEYAAIDNFYTATVYEKGAEIIRMYHTILGEKGFQEGMKRYIERHDGQAVRIEDFAQAMSDGGEYDFSGAFFEWYTTRGTPRVTFTSSYNQRERTFTVAAMQDVDAVSPAKPLVIPIRFSLINHSGRPYRFADGSYEQTLLLQKTSAIWTFERAEPDLIPVLMQDFSAPVYYHHRYDNDELAAIAIHAPDGFARFEAMQILYRRLFEQALKKPREIREYSAVICDIMQSVLTHEKRSEGEKALLLTIPTLVNLLNYLPEPINMTAAIEAYDRIVRILALKMRRNWMDWLDAAPIPASAKYSVKDAGIRKLRGLAEKTLAMFEDEPFRQQLLDEHNQADCMTTRMNALRALNQQHDRYREAALVAFLEKFQAQPLVVDKWFMIQAEDSSADALTRIQKLSEHPAFIVDNPNRFRALVGSFMQLNPMIFHAEDGSGYRFAAAQIRRILVSNPQIAARMLNGYAVVSRLDAVRKALVKAELEQLAAVEGISVDVCEVLERLQHGLL